MQVIWQPLMDGAQSLYSTLKKFDFTFDNYRELLAIYDLKAKAASAANKSNTKGLATNDALLRQTACTWLLREAEPRPNGRVQKNYERWRYARKSKMELLIGGIFPLSGSKFVAKELIPSEYKRWVSVSCFFL